MTRTCLAAAALLAALAAVASAEIPSLSKERLREKASHVVAGKVTAVYTKEEKGQDWHRRQGLVEILVSAVEAGDGVEPGDAVYARFWTQRWVGAGTPPTYGSGHRVPEEGDEVRAYLARKGGGYEALLPNGIEPLPKGERPKGTP